MRRPSPPPATDAPATGEWQEAVALVDRWNHYPLESAEGDPALSFALYAAREQAYVDVHAARV